MGVPPVNPKCMVVLSALAAVILLYGQAVAAVDAAETNDFAFSGAAPRDVRIAVRWMNQAALEWGLVSTNRELELLDAASAHLSSALAHGCRWQCDAVSQLRSQIVNVIARANAQQDPLNRATGASLGPPAPSRSELVGLARNGQDVLRNAPVAQLRRDRVAVDASESFGHREASPPPLAPLDLAGAGLLSWPPDRPSTRALFRFHF